MLRIVIWEGIGDVLYNLSTHPHRYLYRTFGLRTTVFYVPSQVPAIRRYPNPAGTEFFRSLVERLPSLRWGGETTSHKTFASFAYRVARKMTWLLRGKKTIFSPLEPVLNPAERSTLPDFSERPVIGLQTHLLGVKTKLWGLKNWQRFVALLSERHPDAQLVIVEPAEEAERLAAGPNVVTTRHLNFFQLLHLFRQFSFTISIDSWAKYASAWNGIPQIVIVPDQRSDLASFTAGELIRNQFAGIFGQPQNRTIGLEKDLHGQGVLTLDKISQLSPERLLQETEDHLRSFPLRSKP